MSMKRTRLEPSQVEHHLSTLTGWVWSQSPDRIGKKWVFDSFSLAMACIAKIGAIAERLDHHPKIISTYTHLSIELWTHDVQGLSALDFELAQEIDRLIAREFQPQ
jgi:4a-hydroxytetrahydrobiopterin dehydratase